MKKLITLLFLAGNAYAQCPGYICTNTVNVSGNLANQSYNGNQCFSGNGTVQNSTNLNNWNILSFSGSLNIQQTLNFQGGAKKVFIKEGSHIVLNSVSMDNYDTIFNYGDLVINSVVTNNSYSNVVVNGAGATLKLYGASYSALDTFTNTVSNNTNIVVIIGCGNRPLPVVLDYFRKGYEWQFAQVSNVDNVVLEYSKDGMSWMGVYKCYNVRQNYEYSYVCSMAGFFRLKIQDYSGTVQYSNTIFTSQKEQQKTTYDILGRKTTAEGFYIQNNQKFIK